MIKKELVGKLPKDLKILLRQYDPYVDYIDDGKKWRKTKEQNEKIKEMFKINGYDIEAFFEKNHHKPNKQKHEEKIDIKFIAISRESITKYKNAKKCGEVGRFLNVLDENDMVEFDKYGDNWPIVMWEVRNDEVGTIVITKSAVLCEGNEVLVKKIMKNYEKYYNLLKKEGFKYKSGWTKSIPL